MKHNVFRQHVVDHNANTNVSTCDKCHISCWCLYAYNIPSQWYFKSRVNFSQSLFRNLKIISIWYRMENSICLGSQDELLHILWFSWCGGQSQPRKWGQQHLRTHSRVFCSNFRCPHDRAQNKRRYMNWRNLSSIFLHCFLRCTKS